MTSADGDMNTESTQSELDPMPPTTVPEDVFEEATLIIDKHRIRGHASDVLVVCECGTSDESPGGHAVHVAQLLAEAGVLVPRRTITSEQRNAIEDALTDYGRDREDAAQYSWAARPDLPAAVDRIVAAVSR